MYIGAFDIGGTKTIVALADEQGNVFEKEQFVTRTEECYRHLDKCVEKFQQFLVRRQLKADEVEVIGVNLPGVVDHQTGTLIRAVYAGWNQVPVAEYLSQKLQIKRIICENDVNACAVGELRFGLGTQYKNFAWITVSTGVGGAVVYDGKLLRGAHGFAGEFGHLKVEYEAPEECPCGQKGCLEAHSSGTALGRDVLRRISIDKAFKDEYDRHTQSNIGATCAVMAREGNRNAIQIFENAGRYLGRAISYYANILDPEAVVIGGGVAASLDLMVPEIKEAMGEYTFSQMKDIDIVPTALGYEAALYGAIAVAITDIEENR